jgi:hypothetical protein
MSAVSPRKRPGLSWNTVARWSEQAALFAGRFNRARTPGFVLRELQLDEIRTFLAGRKAVTWVFAAIEVWSRLWPATLVGSRSWRNTQQFVREAFLASRSCDCAQHNAHQCRFRRPHGKHRALVTEAG